jgi:2-dehydro-3-deoxyphosphogluconate aldolase/(4S)-4-hydroxy-2-oxoglutarate aldolase
LIPTGGVSLATAAEFLAAGAFALGVGGDLVNQKAIADGKPEIITQTAREYMAIIHHFRAVAQGYTATKSTPGKACGLEGGGNC